MTIHQIECFIEAAKLGSFSKAGTNLFVSQATVSRQIKALEEDLGFPLFERKNLGVKLTEMGMILFTTWEELLITHRTAVDKARDFYSGSQKKIRIGVQDFGKLNDRVRDALFRFAQLSKGLDVEFEILPSNRLLHGIESGEFHIIIAYTSELVKSPNLKVLLIEKLSQEIGIVVSKYHRLARRKQLSLQDLRGEVFGVMGENISVDYKERVLHTLREEHVLSDLTIQEYQSWSKLEFDLLTGKCVTILYDTFLLGLEDRLTFYPVQMTDKNDKRIALAWKDDKHRVKAKNIMDMF